MKIKLEVNSEKEIEFFLNILFFGGVSSIFHNKDNLDYVEYLLFRPSVGRSIKNFNIDSFYVDFIDYGMEIEDVISLVPEKADNYLTQAMESILKRIKNTELTEISTPLFEISFSELK